MRKIILFAICLTASCQLTFANYVQHEWIRADGMSWIYTGYIPADNHIIEAKVNINTSAAYDQTLWCTRNYKSDNKTVENSVSAFLLSKKFRIDQHTIQTTLNSTIVPDVDYIVTQNLRDKTAIITAASNDSVVVSQTYDSSSFTPNGALSLFAGHTLGADLSATTTYDKFSYWGMFRLFYLRVYDADNNLIHNFVPATDSSSEDKCARVGLYDTVENKFWPGLGCGPLTAGEVVKMDGTLEISAPSAVSIVAGKKLTSDSGFELGREYTLAINPAYTNYNTRTVYTATGYELTNAEGTELGSGDGASATFTYTGYTKLTWQFAESTLVLPAIKDADKFKYMVEFIAPSVTYSEANQHEFENIPVLVHLNSDETKFSYSKMSFPDTGADIAFYDTDGNKLAHEIALWNSSGVSTVWVCLPKLETGVKFRMAFGCADVAELQTIPSEYIWGGYTAVWHMDKLDSDVVSGRVTVPDSTGNNLDAVVRLPSVSILTTGKLNKSIVTENSNNTHVRRDRQAGLVVPCSKQYFDGQKFTLSAWLRRISTSSGWGGESLFSTRPQSGAATGGFALRQVNTTSEITMDPCIAANDKVSSIPMIITTWYHFAFAYAPGAPTFYKNGVKGGSTKGTFTPSVFDLGIGAWPAPVNGYAWYGEMDEVRLKSGNTSEERLAVDYAVVNNANYFDIQGVSHGNSKVVEVTKFIPELGLDLDLPECHQKTLTDTNYVFTCNQIPRDYYYTTNNVAYRCAGFKFIPTDGGEIITGTDAVFTFKPSEMGEGELQWQFEKAGYRSNVKPLPVYLNDKAELTVTPDNADNHIFDCYYKEGTVLTVTIADKESGAFNRWHGDYASTLADPTVKTVTYTVNAGENPVLLADVCGVVNYDTDTRIPSDNCARVPKTNYIYIDGTNGNDANDGLTAETAVKTFSTMLARARACYDANKAQQVVCFAPGEYNTSSTTISRPIVFDGGLGNVRLYHTDSNISFTCWNNFSNPRSGMRRLTFSGPTTWSQGKSAGIVQVSNNAIIDNVVISNAISSTFIDYAQGVVRVKGGVITNCLITCCRSPNPTRDKNTYGIINMTSGLLANTRITSCLSEGTTAGYGGAVYMTGGIVRNCLFDNNRAYTQGSAIYVNPTASECRIENCTVVDNAAIEGGAAEVYGVYVANPSNRKTTYLNNNIIYFNSGVGETQKNIMNLKLSNASYVILSNNLTNVEIVDSAKASGNIVANPSFVDRVNKDYRIGIGGAVDKGTNLGWTLGSAQTDLAGKKRILGEAVDIGCYEYESTGELDLGIDVAVPDSVKVGDVVVMTATSVGGAGGYTYTWYVNGVEYVTGPTYNRCEFTIPSAGYFSFKCVVTDSEGNSKEMEIENAVRIYITRGYVSKTGSNTSPYDTPEKAADNFDAVLRLLNPSMEDEIVVGPGEYTITNTIALLQKTHLYSTDGAAKTIIRPASGITPLSNGAAGSTISGFTIEGASGSGVNGLKTTKQLYVTNLVFRSCSFAAKELILAQGALNANNLQILSCSADSFIVVQQTDSAVFHNLIIRDSTASFRGIYTSRPIKVWNSLICDSTFAGNIWWSQSTAASSQFINVTVHNCVVKNKQVFSSNISGNTYRLQNCVIGDVWTSADRTTLANVWSEGACIYNSCIKGTSSLVANTMKDTLTNTDPLLRKNCKLRSASPCIGTGDPSFYNADSKDLEGRPRLHRSGGSYQVDMGCYENIRSGFKIIVR